jgi:hypothetical protein
MVEDGHALLFAGTGGLMLAMQSVGIPQDSIALIPPIETQHS